MTVHRFNFRVYDKNTKRVHPIYHIDVRKLRDLDDRFTVAQSTGMVDIKGVEMYEGDIVRAVDSNGGTLPCKVVWCTSEARWGFEYTHNTTYISLSRGCSDWEVIGNIWQNPELMDPPAKDKENKSL